MELLDQKKTTQPYEQDPKDDLLDHRRAQVATIGPKPRRRRRWLWPKDESLEDSGSAPRNQSEPDWRKDDGRSARAGAANELQNENKVKQLRPDPTGHKFRGAA